MEEVQKKIKPGPKKRAPARKTRGKKLTLKDRIWAASAAVVLILAALGISLLAPGFRAAQDPKAAVPQQSPVTPPAATRPEPAGRAVPEAAGALVEPLRRGTLVFVIDDAGNNLRELEPFLRFSGPLTIAVLPGLPHSAEAARRIRAAGKEVFLHQPMEALGGQNPGPGALYSGMSPAEVRSILERNLAEIGPVTGMNNHQGSKITMESRIMETVLAVCRERGLYFLDSRTTADTVVPDLSRKMALPIGERDVFLDNEPEKAAMIRSLRQGLQRAQQRGFAVMIGHTWSEKLAAVLEELYPELLGEGYSLATVSRFMRGKIE
ncbi:MAG: divergent polysaccharide deacetylase family protein [Spirochaetaceae bacterium]|nr:divergent polysaccharide deacetylase family protein [Spirochaetaceae bacterium]